MTTNSDRYGREASVGRACANPACGRLLPLGPWSWKLCPRCMARGKVALPEPPREPVSRLIGGLVALGLSIVGWGLVFTLVFILFGCAGARTRLSTDCWAGLPGAGVCLTVEEREQIGGRP